MLIIMLAIASIIGLSIQAWMLVLLRRQHARIQDRLDAAALLHTQRTTSIPAAPVALHAPAFALTTLEGDRVPLREFLDPGRAHMLVFASPKCGPCYEVLPDIGGWQRVYGDRLGLAVVSDGTQEINRAMTAEYGIAAKSVLLQEQAEVARAYGVRMLPAAVVIHADGRLAGEVVYGAQAVRQTVAETLGLVMPDQANERVRAVRAGDPVPFIRRPDLDGNPVDLDDLTQGTQTLLVFWSPGCTHCQDLLPLMRRWDNAPDGPHMVVVTKGPVGLNRAADLRSPMVLDDDGEIARHFSIMGTPAGIVIDRSGTVASGIAQGTRELQALVDQRFAPVYPAAD